MNDRTMTFSIGDQTEQEIRRILTEVYDALKEKGYKIIAGKISTRYFFERTNINL